MNVIRKCKHMTTLLLEPEAEIEPVRNMLRKTICMDCLIKKAKKELRK